MIIRQVIGMFLVFIVIGCFVISTYAQTNIPKPAIPADIPDDVKEQIEKLYSLNPVERGSAANQLGQMRSRAVPAIPFLIRILGDRYPLQWRWEQGPPVSHGTKTSPGEEALKALVNIGDPAVEPLIAALKDEDSGVRYNAAVALGDLKDPRAVEPLIAALKDADSGVRHSAAVALGDLKDPRAVEPLIVALKDNYIHDDATKGLVTIGEPAVEPLIAALKEGNSHVREYAAVALGKLKDPRAVEPLIAALKDWISLVRHGAALALVEITGEDFGENPVKWKEWWEKQKKQK